PSRKSRSMVSERLSPLRDARRSALRTSSDKVMDVFFFIRALYSTSTVEEVLEYYHMYHPSNDPRQPVTKPRSTLCLARALVRPRGASPQSTTILEPHR